MKESSDERMETSQPEKSGDARPHNSPGQSPVYMFWKRPWPAIMALVAILIFLILLKPTGGLFITLGTLQLALFIALVVRYIQTRDAGFIFLGIGLLAWPLFIRYLSLTWLNPNLDMVIRGEEVGYFPFTMLEQGRISPGYFAMIFSYIYQIVRESLMIIAVVLIARKGSGQASN